MLLYFDTSAIVKLMRDEAETAALHRFMNSEPNIYFTCDLSRTEIGRVAIRQQLDPAIVAETVGIFDILTLGHGNIQSGGFPAASLLTQPRRHTLGLSPRAGQ